MPGARNGTGPGQGLLLYDIVDDASIWGMSSLAQILRRKCCRDVFAKARVALRNSFSEGSLSDTGTVLINIWLQYKSLYYGSDCIAGLFTKFPYSGTSNLEQPPHKRPWLQYGSVCYGQDCLISVAVGREDLPDRYLFRRDRDELRALYECPLFWEQ